MIEIWRHLHFVQVSSTMDDECDEERNHSIGDQTPGADSNCRERITCESQDSYTGANKGDAQY